MINAKTQKPETGLTLVELMISISLLGIVWLAVVLTIMMGSRHRRESFEGYRALSAMRGLLADIQDTANRREDPVALEGIGSVFEVYNGGSFAIPDVPSGTLTVTCHADETSVPAVFGGPQDLNFDGDALDDLSGAGSGDLKLVPMTLVATFSGGGTTTLHRLVAKTAEDVTFSSDPLTAIRDHFQDLADNNPLTTLGDKAEDVAAKLTSALSYLAASPPDEPLAADAIDGAVADIQAMIDTSLISASEGQGFIETLNALSSSYW